MFGPRQQSQSTAFCPAERLVGKIYPRHLTAELARFLQPARGIDRPRLQNLLQADDRLAVDAAAVGRGTFLEATVEAVGDLLEGQGGHGQSCFQFASGMEV